MRIVSLVPSITELLYHLGLEQETVGITKFCVHPEHWHRQKKRVGGTKNIQVDVVRALSPTLVIASKEENIQQQVEEIALFSEVLLTNVGNFDEALQMIHHIGTLTGKSISATRILSQINNHFKDLSNYASLSAIYLIWKDPWMTVGGDTFIHAMMQQAGFNNVTGAQWRYPEISVEALQLMQPQCVLLSSEPYPFKTEDVEALQELLPFSKVILADGEMFSWYGSRMLYAAPYFKSLRQALNIS